METLSRKQQRFTRLIAQLIGEANVRGYALTFGEAYRSDEQAEINALGGDKRWALCLSLQPQFPALAAAINNNGKHGGISKSLHRKRLAVDFNVFKNGELLTDGSQFEDLGVYWEGLSPDCRWGGRFKDGNHFSLEHEGIR